jgi:hypothetical protein
LKQNILFTILSLLSCSNSSQYITKKINALVDKKYEEINDIEKLKTN